MRIDAHHHVWDLAVRDQPWTAGLPTLRRDFTFGELRPSLDRHGIDACVVIQTVCVPEETPELLTLAAAEQRVRAVVGWTDLTALDVASRLAALRESPGGARLAGIRHQVQLEPDPRWLCRPDVRRGLAAVADHALAYDLVVVPAQLPAVIETVAELPQLRFILDHGGKPPVRAGIIEPWASMIWQLGRLPNVAVKLSGLATEADPANWTTGQLRPYADQLLGAFGADRVMFGSDWPVCLLAGGYDQILAAARELTAHLSAAEQAAVFGGSAARWYGIG
jgi:L-fuconolactonase